MHDTISVKTDLIDVQISEKIKDEIKSHLQSLQSTNQWMTCRNWR
jgi:hypothetical protein